MRFPLRFRPQEAAIREAALGLGKTILFGCAAAATVHGHHLLACELSQAPKALAMVAPMATVERKPPKHSAFTPRIVRLDRRATDYSSSVPSRRIILQ